jgi:mono/diheme cytochrome c family protein
MRRFGPPLVAGLLAASLVYVAVAGSEPERPTPDAPQATAAAGRSVFARMGCGTCHRLAAANARGQIGPDLDRRLPNHTRASLRAKITNPYPNGPGEAFATMPENFGERLTEAELSALVTFLLETRRR